MVAWYCSEECQTRHYRVHRMDCRASHTTTMHGLVWHDGSKFHQPSQAKTTAKNLDSFQQSSLQASVTNIRLVSDYESDGSDKLRIYKGWKSGEATSDSHECGNVMPLPVKQEHAGQLGNECLVENIKVGLCMVKKVELKEESGDLVEGAECFFSGQEQVIIVNKIHLIGY